MTNNKINAISILVGLVVFIITSLPLFIKKTKNKKKTFKRYERSEEWIESPMTINELDNAKNNK